jgi:hypothetical protein
MLLTILLILVVVLLLTGGGWGGTGHDDRAPCFSRMWGFTPVRAASRPYARNHSPDRTHPELRVAGSCVSTCAPTGS